MELCPADDESRPLATLFSPMTGDTIVEFVDAIGTGQQNCHLPFAHRGGFLFEATGLGTTVEMIKIMTKSPPPPAGLPLLFTTAELAAMPGTQTFSQGVMTVRSGATLILAPATLMGEWEREIRSKHVAGAHQLRIFKMFSQKSASGNLLLHRIMLGTITYQPSGTLHSMKGDQSGERLRCCYPSHCSP